MFLPTHYPMLKLLDKRFLNAAWLVNWFDNPYFLFHANVYVETTIPRREGREPVQTTCLFRMPEIIDNRITFRCALPACKATLVLSNDEDKPYHGIRVGDQLHTCLHDSKNFRLYSLLEPKHAPEFWVHPANLQNGSNQVLMHCEMDQFCFSYSVRVQQHFKLDKMELKKMYLDQAEEYLRQQKMKLATMKAAANKALEEFKYTDGVDSLELVKAFTFCNSNALEEIK